MFGICVEASHQRGMGHLFRMLNFCEILTERGIPFRIFVNSHAASKALLLERKLPFDWVSLESDHEGWQTDLIQKYDIKLWIDDRLNTDLGHAVQIKKCGIPLVTFDDRGTGAAQVDLNIVALAFDQFECLQGKKVLRGPRYLVLNREISQYKKLRTTRDSIVVTLGGSDTHGVTMRIVYILKKAGLSATVIVGPAFKHEAELLEVLDDRFVLKRGVPSLIEEFSHHDLAITGGGITPFEANASGLPCIVIANEKFEISVGHGLAAMGGAVFVGHYTSIDETLLIRELPIQAMSEAAMHNIDLLGAKRVADEIEALL